MAIIIRKHLKLVHDAPPKPVETVESGADLQAALDEIIKEIAYAAAELDHMRFLEKQWSK